MCVRNTVTEGVSHSIGGRQVIHAEARHCHVSTRFERAKAFPAVVVELLLEQMSKERRRKNKIGRLVRDRKTVMGIAVRDAAIGLAGMIRAVEGKPLAIVMF